ncbi:MAG: polysaccharide pyruvyl transferase CsaB [Oscillospiraceae bacterium]|nr:polysaccharide pyruvyl transferase CsaB [Oscillospiraceae bacterium]
MSKSQKLVISGYYGYDNCGDEAVLLSIVSSLKELMPNIIITVLSGNPTKTKELYGVKAINRWNPFAIFFALMSCRMLISGGGSLLQDETSTKSLRYYLAIINLARMLGKKVMIYSQGIGPLNADDSRKMVQKTLNRCHEITVRDTASASLLREIGITREIKVVCDPVLLLSSLDYADLGIIDELEQLRLIGEDGVKKNFVAQKPILLAAIRCWKDDGHIIEVAKFLDEQTKNGYDVLLVPAHYPDDLLACVSIRVAMSSEVYCINKSLTAKEFNALTSHADYVFSMRLHGLICAYAAGTPILALSYDPKVDAFMEQVNLKEYCLAYDNFESNKAMTLFEKLSHAPKETQLAHKETMNELAWSTSKKAIELLKQ